jgi:hypothetical protein
MITTTIEVRGVKLDIRHDGDTVHCIEPHDQEDIYPLLDARMVAEIRAELFGSTLAEVNARRGFPTLPEGAGA